MLSFSTAAHAFVGSRGTLSLPLTAVGVYRLAMLLEGECELGPTAAADKFGISRQRYYQLRQQLAQQGPAGLEPQRRGPKGHHRRTETIVRQVIRARLLEPEASAEVITQKLVQTGGVISCRSVERIIEDYGLQKKTLSQT